jgi:hypothetical protein
MARRCATRLRVLGRKVESEGSFNDTVFDDADRYGHPMAFTYLELELLMQARDGAPRVKFSRYTDPAHRSDEEKEHLRRKAEMSHDREAKLQCALDSARGAVRTDGHVYRQLLHLSLDDVVNFRAGLPVPKCDTCDECDGALGSCECSETQVLREKARKLLIRRIEKMYQVLSGMNTTGRLQEGDTVRLNLTQCCA